MTRRSIAIPIITALTLLTACGGKTEPTTPAATSAPVITTAATTDATPETEKTTEASAETEAEETTTEETTVELSPPERAIVPPEDELIVQYDAALGGAVIEGYTGTEPDIRLPDMIGEDKVLQVYITDNNKKVKTLIIPEGVTDVYCKHFQNLEYVELPSTVTELSENAFQDCEHLSYINLDNITVFGERCLEDCNIDHIDWADEVTYIGAYAFTGSGITEVEVPFITPQIVENEKNDCTYWNANIGEGIFMNCYELTKATVHNTIFKGGFCGCKSLEEINFICDDENYYSYQADYNGKDATQYYMTINENALNHCDALTTVNFVNCEDTFIGKKAFYNCTSLRTLDLSNVDNVIWIADNAFEECPALTVTYNGKEYNHTNFDELYAIFSNVDDVYSVNLLTD